MLVCCDNTQSLLFSIQRKLKQIQINENAFLSSKKVFVSRHTLEHIFSTDIFYACFTSDHQTFQSIQGQTCMDALIMTW